MSEVPIRLNLKEWQYVYGFRSRTSKVLFPWSHISHLALPDGTHWKMWWSLGVMKLVIQGVD